mgnify:CR=1 FL=1
MPHGGGSSYLGNMEQRRRGLNRTRSALLDQPGIPRRGGPPPATSPAQDRASPQKQALDVAGRRATTPTNDEQMAVAEAAPPGEEHVFDEETRQRLLGQIRPFLREVHTQKRAQLHRRVGRHRRFFGSGI